MNQNIENSLQQAFSLIETGKLEDAKALLRPILEVEKDNADVWWLYSHAVTDVETARLALYNVLRIESEYPDARELLNQLETQRETEQGYEISDVMKDPDFIPPIPSGLPSITSLQPRNTTLGTADEDDLPDEILDEDMPISFYRRPLFYVPIITLLLLAALVIVITKPFANSTSVQSPISTVDSGSTIEPTISSLGIQPTGISGVETGVTTEAQNDLSPIVNAFSGFNLTSNDSIQIADTSLGKTLLANICSAPGKEMRDLLPKAMSVLAKASTSYETLVQAIAVRLLDCSSNTTLIWIGSSVGDAVAYANASLGEKDFQATWKPVK